MFTLAEGLQVSSEEAFLCGAEHVCFTDVRSDALRIAGALSERGVGEGSRVAWLGQNCHRALETLFACSFLGAVFVPVNWRLSDRERSAILDDAGPVVSLEGAPELGEEFHGGVVDENAPVVQMYTAAFDGAPRGALLTHRNLIAASIQMAYAQKITAADSFLLSVPVFHILGLGQALAHLMVGARTVVVPKSDPAEMARLIEAEKITRAIAIGPARAALEESGRDLSSLRHDPIAGYGQTECSGLVTFDALGGIGSHGRPGPLASVRIDASGEILVRGPQVSPGYADGTSRTQADGWHHTGDVGRQEEDGSISFIGPIQEIIKTGAENVYPVEVEAALRRHHAVRDVVVFGIPDQTWRAAVKAVVVVSEPITEQDLIEFCRTQIASYKKPRVIEFVPEIPRTPGGAVDRDEVKRRWA